MADQKKEKVFHDDDGNVITKEEFLNLKKAKAEAVKARKAQEAAERAEKLRLEQEAKKAKEEEEFNNEVDFVTDMYGDLPLNQSQSRENKKFVKLLDIDDSMVNQTILVRGRLQNKRIVSGKKIFVILRQQNSTAQCVVSYYNPNDESAKSDNKIPASLHMIRYIQNIPTESLIDIVGYIVKPANKVKSCTVSDYELQIKGAFTVSKTTKQKLPYTFESATRPDEKFVKEEPADKRRGGNKEQAVRVTLDTCLNNRVYDLRTITNHAIFKIQAAVCRIFRNFLDSKGFTEIHTPKLIGAASEGGASVFEVKYFNTKAYLAQSPQFYKQMMISSDFERVYEIGPVFRAENSNTHRHLTEFTGLDLEMAFNEHYHEVLDLFDELFVTLFTELKEKYAYEISIVQKQFPVPDFEFLPKSLRLQFKDAVKLLKDEVVFIKQKIGVETVDDILKLISDIEEDEKKKAKNRSKKLKEAKELLDQIKEEYDLEDYKDLKEAESMGDFDDLSTKNERFLGKAVKRVYKTDFYMLDKFPKAVRPFYTMEDPEKDGYSNSYDFFMRGEEIMSGAQRIHDPEMLKKSAIEHGVDPTTIQGYLDAFEYGVSPHAGGGIGLERIVMLYFGLGQVKRASLFPRDPSRLSP